MLDSTKRPNCCSLCLSNGHRANGARCPVVRRYNASVVGKDELAEFASGVGNPVSHEVKNLDSMIQQDIAVWKERVIQMRYHKVRNIWC
jgi:hypothetical protein